MILERILYGWLGLCTYLFIKDVINLYKGDILEKVLDKEKANDLKVIFHPNTLKTIIVCGLIIVFPLIPFFDAYEWIKKNRKGEE